LAFDENEHRLYVALANRDKVVAIDLRHGRVEQTFSTLPRGETQGGSFPVSLAIHDDRPFVADAGLNAVAVYDRLQERGKKGWPPDPNGLIPTEWYPVALSVVGKDADDAALLIASAKGTGAGPNGKKDSDGSYPYIFTLLHGSLAKVARSE